MIRIENTSVVGWEAAIRGMRNPMNSWDRSDSLFLREDFCDEIEDWKLAKMCGGYAPIIKGNDLDLMKRLRNAGTDHRKFMRMIIVTFDLTAPLYWWKEFDTYKVGTVANSCSTMHKIHSRPLTMHDFSTEWLEPEAKEVLMCVIDTMNTFREFYCDNHNKGDWYQMIQLLPTSYNQKRTILLNYEVLANIYKSRRNHKLDEWHDLCHWIETLPYSELITGKGDGID